MYGSQKICLEIFSVFSSVSDYFDHGGCGWCVDNASSSWPLALRKFLFC